MTQKRVSTGSQRGFTLVELMVVIAIIGILAALAAPSFSTLRNQKAIDGTARSLVSALNLARTTALATRQEAYLCLSDDGKTCDAGSNGWIVYTATRLDPDSSAQRTQQELIYFSGGNSSVSIDCLDNNGAGNLQSVFVFYNGSYRGNRLQIDTPPIPPKYQAPSTSASTAGAECVIDTVPSIAGVGGTVATVTIAASGLVEVWRP